MNVTAYSIASRFLGVREIFGADHNPLILAMLRLDFSWVESDETPWCSAFANAVAWILSLPRSRSLRARSWLRVGVPVDRTAATIGWDVVVLQRGGGPQPGPEVLDAPGHVGFFAGWEDDGRVLVLGGNQSNQVSIAPFPAERVLGIRSISPTIPREEG